VNCADFKAVGKSAVEDFESRIASLPVDICAPFYEEAGHLEAAILTVYKSIVLAAKHLDDLNDVANLWGCMVEVCDCGIHTLSNLVKEHPACGAEYYYDRLLDLRNRCLRLQNLHA
jgi:hypothetical protein